VAVVADAGPLIALARITRVDLRPALYDEIIVPPTVYREITTKQDFPGAAMFAQAAWLRVGPIADLRAVECLQLLLDRGESEAIVLARLLRATLLMDERRGRAIANTFGVSVTGTIGILRIAKQRGRIDQMTPLLDALRSAGVRLSQRLYDEARRSVGEG
jgi:predicted nucleic acid-binding protein